MAILKVIEVLANSDKSWADAAQKAVTKASATVNNIKSVYVKEQTAVVVDNKITQYRVNVKITFEVR